jgi:hypothetical protein
VGALLKHCPRLRVDYVLANNNMTPLQPEFPADLVRRGDFSFGNVHLVEQDLMSEEFRIHHDPWKLAQALTSLYHESVRRNGRRSAQNDQARRRVAAAAR